VVSVLVEFVGGPLDGVLREMPHAHLELVFPIYEPLRIDERPGDVVAPRHRCHVYRAAPVDPASAVRVMRHRGEEER
jgi:hypothetical protein